MKKISVALMTYAIDGRQAKGTAVVARQWVDELLKHRDELDLTFIHYEKCDDPIYSHGVQEVIIPSFRIGFFNRRSLRQMYYFFTTKDCFDILQWFQPRLYFFFWRAPAKHLVVTVHGAGDVTAYNHFNLMRHIFNWTLILFRHTVDIAIAGSDYSGKDIVKYYRFDPEQVRVVNNGADQNYKPASAEEIARVREKYKLPEKFFLGVGRLIQIKNTARTLRAFEQFCKETGNIDMRFVNVGAGGPEREHIDRLMAESPYRNRMSLLKYVDQDDLAAVYSASYALVFPLLNEGFGLPAIEAMACGTPTVISQTAAPEITNHDAELVDALDVGDIARGMRNVLENKDRYSQLKTAGLELAKKFTWEASANKVVDIYRELIRG